MSEIKAYYDEPCRDRPCMNCKYMTYDSFHDETWCDHKPPPDGLGARLLVDKWGSCEFWEEYGH